MVRYYDLNKPIPELNNLSLTQVFETGNLVTNGDFSDGTTGWSISGAVSGFQVNDGIASFTATSNNSYVYQQKTLTLNNKYYYTSLLKADYPTFYLNAYLNASPYTTLIADYYNDSGVFETHSGIVTNNISTNNFVIRLRDYSGSGWTPVYFDDIYLLDLTTLNIADLTKEQMDYWFSIYQDSKGAVGSAFVQHAGIDTVIPNLNNKTLREVFESNNDIINGGLLLDNDNNGSPDNFSFMTTNLSGIENNIIFFRSSSLYGRVFQNAPYVTNNVYYYNVRFQSTSSNVFFNNGNLDELRLYHVGDGVMRNHSAIDIWGQPSSSNVQTRIIDGRTSNFDNVYLEHMYKINLTSLGIDTLTQTEMDYYFSLYQSWKQKTLYIGKSKNLFDGQWTDGQFYSSTTGVIFFNGGRTRSTNLIDVLPSTNYYIKLYDFDNASGLEIVGYDENNNYVNYLALGSPMEKTFTTLSNVYKIGISVVSNAGDFNTLGTYAQLEQRTFATNYEQYYTPKTWIAPAFQQHALTDTKLIDTKLAYLNGYSIREVFENGNGYYGVGQGNSFSYNTIRVYSLFQNVELNDKIYINTNTYSKETIRVGVVNGSQTVWPITTPYYDSGWLSYDLHDIYTMTYTGSLTLNFSYPNNATLLVNDFNNLNLNIYTINLTALGIDHLTQAELDQMFALYQDRNKNLFDKSDSIIQDFVIDSLGNIAAVTGEFYQETYIKVSPSTNYTLSKNGALSSSRMAFYTNDFTFITRLGSSTKTTTDVTVTSPSNAAYVRLALTYAAIDDIQLELGTTATPYHAYGGFSLKDVFETGNLVTNGDFSDGTIVWLNSAVSSQINNNELEVTGNLINSSIGLNHNINNIVNNYYYFTFDAKPINDVNLVRVRVNNQTQTLDSNPINNVYKTHSILFQETVGTSANLRYDSIAVGSRINYDNIVLLNLTTLNIADLTKDFMDDLYGAYSKTYQAPAFIDKYGVLNAPSFQVTAGLDTAFADLNGLTLREVFEDGNLLYPFEDTNSDGLADGYSSSNAYNYSFQNNTQTIYWDATGYKFSKTIGNKTGSSIYISSYVYVTTQPTSIGITAYGSSLAYNTTINEWEHLSKIVSGGSSSVSLYHYVTSSLVDTKVKIQHPMAIDLTALGINLTKEQMDWYFQLYKTYKGGM